MAHQEYKADQIADEVQDALERGDFSKIQEMVIQGVAATARSVGPVAYEIGSSAVRGVEAAASALGDGIAQAAEQARAEAAEHQRVAAEQARAQAAERQRAAAEQARAEAQQYQTALAAAARYGDSGGPKLAGLGMIVSGIILAAVFGGVGIFSAVSAALTGSALIGVGGLVSLITAAAGIGLAFVGGKHHALASRFDQYRQLIGMTEAIPVAALANRTHRSAKYITKDLSKMVKRHLLKQAHLDDDQQVLYLTDASYAAHQRQEAELARQRRQREQEAERARQQEQERQQQAAAQAEEGPRPLTAGERQRIDDGYALLRQIHSAIPSLSSEETQKKVKTLHLLASTILNRAQQDPDTIEDLDRMVDYYLPLALKLEDTYAELAAQPLQTESIGASRREIENTFDTLIHAFAKLHDSLFQEMIWDVSTDISVLNAILAQEGLTDSPFTKNEGDNHE